MNKLLIATAVIAMSASSVFAQTATPTPNPDGDTPAVATPQDKNAAAPVEGANSFTEDQARTRIGEAGQSRANPTGAAGRRPKHGEGRFSACGGERAELFLPLSVS